MEEESFNLKKNERNFADNFNPISKKQSFPIKPIKKKRNKSKKIFLIFVIVLIVGISGFFYVWDDPKKDVFLEGILGNIQNQSSENFDDSEENMVPTEREVLLKEGLANPRLSIRNGSGDEVIGLDHNGTIVATDIFLDENVNMSGNATGRYGFFSYVGSLADQLTKLWVIDIVAGDVNSTGNLTTGGIILNSSTNLIRDNASCVIIEGSTSTSYIC